MSVGVTLSLCREVGLPLLNKVLIRPPNVFTRFNNPRLSVAALGSPFDATSFPRVVLPSSDAREWQFSAGSRVVDPTPVSRDAEWLGNGKNVTALSTLGVVPT